MMTESILKIVGIGATVIGLGASVAQSIVEDKKMDLLIEKKVAAAIARLNG